MIRIVLLLVIVCVAISACTSPESTRTRGGAGADVGNRSGVVKMHQGASPFYQTPDRIPALQHMSLEGADQADRLSR